MTPVDAPVEVVSTTYAEEAIVALQYRPLASPADTITDVLDGDTQGFLDARPVYTARREARIDRDGREGWMVAEPTEGLGVRPRTWPVLVPDGYGSEEALAERLYAETPGTGSHGGDWLDEFLPGTDSNDIL